MKKKSIVFALIAIGVGIPAVLFAAGILAPNVGAGPLNPGQWNVNQASSTITPNPSTLQVPCANIVGGCAGGSASTTLVKGINGVTTTQSGANVTSSLDTSFAASWSALQTFANGATFNGITTHGSTTNAIIYTDASGTEKAYVGANCTTQGISAISPTGTATCATFATSTGSGGGGNVNMNSTSSALAGAFALVDTNGSSTLRPSSTLFQNASGIEASGTSYYSLYVKNATTSAASSTSINWATGNVQSIVLATNTTFLFTNTQAGGRYILGIGQDATGTRTVTWPSNIHFPGNVAANLSTASNTLDIITFVCMTVSGTDCYAGSNVNYTP